MPWGCLRTDADGRCRVGELPPGKYRIRVAAAGKAMAWAMPEFDDAVLGGTVQLDVGLRDAVPLKVRAVDADGAPVGFEAFTLTARVENPTASNAVCCTDSAGRLYVPDRWGDVDVELDRHTLLAMPRGFEVRTSADVHEVVVDRAPLLRVLLRPGTVVCGLIVTGPGGGHQSMGVKLPASEVLLRLGPGAEKAMLRTDDGSLIPIPVDRITTDPEQVVDLRGDAK